MVQLRTPVAGTSEGSGHDAQTQQTYRNEWRSRGYLPHFDGGNAVQMVTFRLADSFPLQLLTVWREELAHLSDTARDAERRKRIESYLDRGTGTAWLHDARIAALVQDSLLHFDGARYQLHAWVIMPNHVHAMLTPTTGHPLPDIMHSWKSYTSTAANRLLKRTGEFWYREYVDRYIRNDKHYTAAITYIEGNPVRAGLCARVQDWPWSSGARIREPVTI